VTCTVNQVNKQAIALKKAIAMTAFQKIK